MELSVIIPTHNPDPERLRRTLLGLRAQTLPPTRWETLLVNNASREFPSADFFAAGSPENLRIVAEPELGLTAARRHGFNAARADCAVLVDDDNVLAPDYLAQVLSLFSAHPQLGTLGGRSLPEFATPPAPEFIEFLPLLALRDLGPDPLIATSLRPPGAARNEYPACAPIGAGLAIRRPAWTAWLASLRRGFALSDRRGDALTSGGDNDIVLAALHAGWGTAYFPQLSLTHLIPASRLQPAYLARLNRGIQKSWMQVLRRHDANPWPPLGRSGAGLRKLKAWLALRAWSSPAAQIRWQGVCGHFDGRVHP